MSGPQLRLVRAAGTSRRPPLRLAWESGFESVDGFARVFSCAYGHPPSGMPPTTDRGHWLPAPNGIHFHGPTALYVDSQEGHGGPSGDVLALLVRHDLDDTAALLASAEGLDHGALSAVRLPGHRVLTWAGPEESAMDVLCDPPESFLLGQILAHDLTFCAHRRQLVRWMLRDAGLALDAEHLDPDPIMWHRRQSGERR